jgi:hypothetical protein
MGPSLYRLFAIKNLSTRSTLVILVIAAPFYLYGQQLDNMKGRQPLTLNGFISTNQVFNGQPTDSGTITNYSGYYTGSLNFNIYGVSVPLTFIYSNNQGNFTHPFNQYGMHPSYKWVKGHIGYASMTFSPYTLNGHLFLGVGVEVDPPGLLRAGAMYGRLKNAVEYDSLNQSLTAFKRMGFGIKAGIAKDGDCIDISLFRANDIENSITALPENPVLPQQNSAMSVSFNKQLVKNLSIAGELASSYLTTDSRTDKEHANNAFLKPPIWFMPNKQSTINRNAIRSNITYKLDRYSLGVGYERVDPDYQTLGAYYFTNNLENVTFNFATNFLENKINVGGNLGLQKDNLDNSKMNNSKRVVGSGNINVIPGEKLNLNLAYSNFTSYTNVKSTFDYINETDPYENWDTLNFRQISQNINLNSSYQLSNSKDKKQNISVNLTWQKSNDSQENDSSTVSGFYNAGASYLLSLVPYDLNISTSLNYNRNETPGAISKTWGPVISISKLFLEKTLRTSLTTSYNTSKTGNFPASAIVNLRLGTAYTLKKQHSFNLNFLVQQRNNTLQKFTTYSLTFGYSYNFNIINKNKQNNETKAYISD